MYEMIHGRRPFKQWKSSDVMDPASSMRFGSGVSAACQDFLRALLTLSPSKRLGCGPGRWEEVKSHAWFSSTDWEAVRARSGRAPISPDKDAANCFDPSMRVLTSDGFLFEVQIAAALADLTRAEPLLFACFDKKSGGIVYASGQLVHPPNKDRKLVVFDDPCHHQLLRVTPSHDMFVQLSKGTRGREVILDPPEKRTAAALYSSCGDRSIRFQGVAPQGVQQTPSLLEWWEPFELSSDEQVNAFLELYGFWLGEGSMGHDRDNRLRFAQRTEADLDFLREVLPACGLRAEQEWTEHANHEIVIKRASWFAIFDAEYGKGSIHHDSTRVWNESAKWLFSWARTRLSAKQTQLLIRGVWRANGTWKQQTCSIYTASVLFRDELMQLLLHCGYGAHFSRGSRAGAEKGWVVHWSQLGSEQGESACYPDFDGARMQQVQYDEPVWCVNVAHRDHLIIAQGTETEGGVVTRAGRPVIVSNCNNSADLADQLMDKEPEAIAPELQKYFQGFEHNTDLAAFLAKQRRDEQLTHNLSGTTALNVSGTDLEGGPSNGSHVSEPQQQRQEQQTQQQQQQQHSSRHQHHVASAAAGSSHSSSSPVHIAAARPASSTSSVPGYTLRIPAAQALAAGCSASSSSSAAAASPAASTAAPASSTLPLSLIHI